MTLLLILIALGVGVVIGAVERAAIIGELRVVESGIHERLKALEATIGDIGKPKSQIHPLSAKDANG